MKQITFQSVFDTPTVKMGNFNELGVTPDGRIWEYAYASEAITKHMIVSTPAVTGVDTVSSAAATDDSTKYIYITEASAGWTVGAYQDYWVMVDSGTGVGQVGKVKTNTTDTLELYRDHAFTTALAVADSDITLVPTPQVEKSPITNVYTPCRGVAQVTFASGDYGWFLRRGIGGVLMGEAATVSRGITPGDDTEGTGAVVDDGDDLYDATLIGYCIAAQDTADKACMAQVNVM
jgi:hypothetical protein